MFESKLPETEYTKERTLVLLKDLIDFWNFKDSSDVDTNNFTTHLTHWTLETFGQKTTMGEFRLYPHGDGFDGNELPLGLRSLVTQEFGDELYVTKENQVGMHTQHVVFETDSFIPEYDQIEKLTKFSDRLEYIMKRPDIIAGIRPTMLDVIPQVAMIYRPHFSYSWGIQYLISQAGIKTIPFGEVGKTEVPFRYVVDNLKNNSETARCVCELAILAAKYTTPFSHEMDFKDAVELLFDRLNGEASLPLLTSEFGTRSSSAVKNLLIERLMEHPDEKK